MNKQKQQQVDAPIMHQFSWMKKPVDVTKECPICMLLQNSPCEDAANQFYPIEQKENKTKQDEIVADKLWDKLLDCMNKNKSMLQKREVERDKFFDSYANKL